MVQSPRGRRASYGAPERLCYPRLGPRNVTAAVCLSLSPSRFRPLLCLCARSLFLTLCSRHLSHSLSRSAHTHTHTLSPCLSDTSLPPVREYAVLYAMCEHRVRCIDRWLLVGWWGEGGGGVLCILALHRSSASLSPSPVRRGAPVDGTPSLTLSVRRATGMFVSSGDVFPIDTLRSDRSARGFGRIFEWPVCV